MIIEFSGTPSSGKSSLIKSLKETNSFDLKIVEESFIESEFDFHINNHELRTLWRIFDTYVRMARVIQKDSQLSNTVYAVNRGLLDRVVWARFLSHGNDYYRKISTEIESNLRRHFSKIDIVFLLISPYDKVKSRRLKRGLGVNEIFVNSDKIEILNSIYHGAFQDFKSELNILKVDETSQNISLQDKFDMVLEKINSYR